VNWDYVALGDSNPGGFGVSHSYVDIYADYIASDMGVGVRVHNWASYGATSTSLLSRLSSSSELQQDIRNAEIITIDIGANDWTPVLHMYPHKECGGSDNQDCLRELLQTYKQNLKAILQEIADLQGENAGTLIRLVDLYMSNCDYPNIYRVGESEVFNGIKPYLDEFNAFISEAAQTHHAKVVPLYLTFNGPEGNQNPRTYLQGDQCHLRAKGHQKVADMLRELGYEK
jgi:lysophospholipase L1-like esterase